MPSVRVHQSPRPATDRLDLCVGGHRLSTKRAGIEGTLSQGVRAFALRRTRYLGHAKTRLQHIATAAAMNIDRLVNWLEETPQAQTRISRFKALAV